MKNQRIARFVAGLSLLAMASSPSAFAALSVASATSGSASGATSAAQQLVDLLIPNTSSIVVSSGTQSIGNSKWSSGDAVQSAIGTFAGGSSANDLPFASGVVLSTGRLTQTFTDPNDDNYNPSDAGVLGPNDYFRSSHVWGDGPLRRSTTLENALGLSGITQRTSDTASLSFQFSSHTANSVSFQYMFASEEYAENINQVANDAFVFLLKDITAGGAAVNLALIGGQPVSVNTINNGPSETGPSVNGAYYNSNPVNSNNYILQFDGVAGGYDATKLYATHSIIPDHVYQIDMILSDVGDQSVDSSVFIGAGTFTDTPPPSGVPEPSTYVGALALAGLVVRKLRRKA